MKILVLTALILIDSQDLFDNSFPDAPRTPEYSSQDESEDTSNAEDASTADDAPIRSSKITLDPIQEIKVVDFLKDNPMFYDKTHIDYKNKVQKEKILKKIRQVNWSYR